MTRFWLVKQEPSSYSWSSLARDGETEWDGVHNALALRYLREMSVGDLAFFYHSGDERSCVGVLRVVRGPRLDPHDTRVSYSVKVRAEYPLPRPVSISEMRSDPSFAGFELLRFSRLSVIPVSERHWNRVLALSREVASPETSGPRGARSGRAQTSGRRRRGGAARRKR